MDYAKVYKDTFCDPTYSSGYDSRYDFVLENVLGTHFIDIGSGRGQTIKNLKKNIHCVITSVDLEKFHNEQSDYFIQCNLANPEDRKNIIKNFYDTLICTDVLEHLDKSFIEDVVKMCSQMAKRVIFTIANHSDIINGVELHTIQENSEWWDTLLLKYFVIDKIEISSRNDCYKYVLTPTNQ